MDKSGDYLIRKLKEHFTSHSRSMSHSTGKPIIDNEGEGEQRLRISTVNNGLEYPYELSLYIELDGEISFRVRSLARKQYRKILFELSFSTKGIIAKKQNGILSTDNTISLVDSIFESFVSSSSLYGQASVESLDKQLALWDWVS